MTSLSNNKHETLKRLIDKARSSLIENIVFFVIGVVLLIFIGNQNVILPEKFQMTSPGFASVVLCILELGFIVGIIKDIRKLKKLRKLVH